MGLRDPRTSPRAPSTASTLAHCSHGVNTLSFSLQDAALKSLDQQTRFDDGLR